MCGGRILFFLQILCELVSWMVWIYKKTRVIPDSCDVLIARNEEESHIEHLVPTKNPHKKQPHQQNLLPNETGNIAFPPVVFDGGFAGWWKRRSISTPSTGARKSSQISEKMELCPYLFPLFHCTSDFFFLEDNVIISCLICCKKTHQVFLC